MSPMNDVKRVIVARRKPGTTLAEHRHHIRHVHGELVLPHITTDPANAPKRYAQNAVFDGSFRASAPGTDPFALNRDFVTEIWVPDIGALKRPTATHFYIDKLKPDEDNFLDQTTVVFMPSHERELHVRDGTVPAAPGAFKLFMMLRRARCRCSDVRSGLVFDRRRIAGPRRLLAPAAPRAERRVARGRRAPRRSMASTSSGSTTKPARALLTQWQGWLREALVQPGLVTKDGHFALLANELVLYAGTTVPVTPPALDFSFSESYPL